MRKSRRSDFRRIKRRAADNGGFRMECILPTVSQVKPLIAEAMEIEASGWKGTKGHCLNNDPMLQDFFITYCRRMAESKALYIFLLKLGDESVAVHIAVRYAEALWILKIGYKERMRHLSPGLFLTLETIRFAIEAGLRRYVFLGCHEEWQNIWPVECGQFGTKIFMPFSLNGIKAIRELSTQWLQK
ncbi:MAG: GNAT family N-acetyltransferase [Proteobacteria bacterium]|nr:MAG: GNAT family N-acetyltransferase [Pseudomonadota bacterium]